MYTPKHYNWVLHKKHPNFSNPPISQIIHGCGDSESEGYAQVPRLAAPHQSSGRRWDFGLRVV